MRHLNSTICTKEDVYSLQPQLTQQENKRQDQPMLKQTSGQVHQRRCRWPKTKVILVAFSYQNESNFTLSNTRS